MKLANSDIRELMKKKKVPVYAVGAKFGVHENTIFRRLRFELSEAEKEKYKNAIDEIAAQKA